MNSPPEENEKPEEGHGTDNEANENTFPEDNAQNTLIQTLRNYTSVIPMFSSFFIAGAFLVQTQLNSIAPYLFLLGLSVMAG
ncbi:MAG: hypothetical protein R6U44_01575 [Archaeoglobaceae archaeon]